MGDTQIVIGSKTFPEGVALGFSTRQGGVSEGIYKSMNPDPRREDLIENVIENCRRLGDVVGFTPEDMVMTDQIHEDTIIKVTEEDRGIGLFKQIETNGDAFITNSKNVALTVFTADCTPILLYDPIRKAIGAVHSGWRGTAIDIVGKTVAQMSLEYGCKPENIYSVIGPCISACCFETQGEVPSAMRELLGDDAECSITRTGDKYHVDLKLINKLLLERAGVNKIEIIKNCTACETDMFWSHRRMGLQRGSLAAVIMLT
ncbi:MAG: peptidoglycan editing factor PgeF [Eubacteriales bacterium]|nr:peptidoglycan editing factor PgeF [Eubacteriales bacterium]